MFQWLRRSQKANYIVAVIEEDVYCPVSYVRVVNHLQNAPEGWVSSIFTLPKDARSASRELRNASALFLARATSAEAAALASEARDLGLPVIYDIDDYLWKLPDYVSRRDLAGGVDAVLAHATLLLTPSETLRDFVRERFPALPAVIVPNSADILADRSAVRRVRAVLANSDFFRLRDMKNEFFEAIRDGARAAGAILELYYLSNDAPEKHTDDPSLQVIWCGVRSYSSYRRLLESISPEIAFVPLPDDHFSRYKSVIKFAEFGRHRIAAIYSRVEPYASFVRAGEDGWLSENTPSSWKAAVAQVLSMAPSDLDRVRSKAAARSTEEFAGETVRSKFFAALQSAGLRSVSMGGTPRQPPPAEMDFVFREAYDYMVERCAALAWENGRLRRSDK